VEATVQDRRRRIDFRPRSHPCTQPGCGQNVIPEPEAGERSVALDLDVVQVLLEESCACSFQKRSFFMRYFPLSISKGNRELFLLRSFRPWSSF